MTLKYTFKHFTESKDDTAVFVFINLRENEQERNLMNERHINYKVYRIMDVSITSIPPAAKNLPIISLSRSLTTYSTLRLHSSGG